MLKAIETDTKKKGGEGMYAYVALHTYFTESVCNHFPIPSYRSTNKHQAIITIQRQNQSTRMQFKCEIRIDKKKMKSKADIKVPSFAVLAMYVLSAQQKN